MAHELQPRRAQARWPGRTPTDLFVSHRALSSRRNFPPPKGPWVLDRGAFSESSMFGGWRTSEGDDVAAVCRGRDEIGNDVIGNDVQVSPRLTPTPRPATRAPGGYRDGRLNPCVRQPRESARRHPGGVCGHRGNVDSEYAYTNEGGLAEFAYVGAVADTPHGAGKSSARAPAPDKPSVAA